MRRRIGLEGPGLDEGGFTLIELVIVVVILPIVIGGIAAALLSVFGLQTSVENRIGNSNDQLVSASTFNKDVQSAQQIETVTTPPACGPATGQTQLVGLQWGLDTNGTYQTVVSYVVVPTQATVAPYKTTNSLVRQICTSGASTTPTNSRTISHDIATPVTNGCTASSSPPCTVTFNPSGFMPANASWVSTQQLFGVFLNVVAPGSSFTYTLSGLPSAGAATGSLSQIQLAQNPAGCNLASPNSGSYSKLLCFADFTAFTNANSNTTYCPSGSGQQMTLSISDSPDVLQFCVKYSGSTIVPHVIPTYYNPGNQGYNSEAYLGNNGFYTGISGNPALLQTVNGGYTVVTFTNIQVTNAVGEPATGWSLITGDAESTDANEWINFTTNLTWSILPNTTSSLYGNSCLNSNNTPTGSGLFQWNGSTPPTTAAVGNTNATNDAPPSTSVATTLPTPTGPNYATGVSSILCEANQQLNKTGTLMLSSPEPGNRAAQSVQVTMQGAGEQGLFLGVLL
jgi:prepilin-type N-terminal cleavage/methylation domain-containing protein